MLIRLTFALGKDTALHQTLNSAKTNQCQLCRVLYQRSRLRPVLGYKTLPKIGPLNLDVIPLLLPEPSLQLCLGLIGSATKPSK